MAGDLVPDARKIAVLRANGLGDFIFALPALDALRAAYPRAEIVLLGLPWHAAFLRGRPGPVDRVVVVPPSRGVRVDRPPADEATLARFFAEMAAERFDLALQLHGGGSNSNPFVRRLGARLTAGLKADDAPPLDRWVPYLYFQREVLRYLEAVALVGARVVTLEPRVAVTEGDLAEAERAVPEAAGRLALLHPGAGDGRRRWPPEKFAAVGDRLAAAGLAVGVVGTEAERPLVERVRAAMAEPSLDLCGRLSIGGLAGLLSRCAVFVGNDSGPLHLARAVGAATVGVYWCGNYINAGPMTQARHRVALSWNLECPVCGLNCIEGYCGHHESFVADVPVEEVAGAAEALLALG